MTNDKKLTLKNFGDGNEYSLNISPKIEIVIVKDTGPDLEVHLENLQTSLTNYFEQIADDALDDLIVRKIVEVVGEQRNAVKIIRHKNDWLKYRPLHTLGTYFLLADDNKSIVTHERLYGILTMDVGKLIQNLVYVLGDVSSEEIWDELLWSVFDIFETCFFEAEDYFPIKIEENKNIPIPVWYEMICDDHIESYFNKDRNNTSECVDIGAYMRIHMTGIKRKEFVLPLEKIEEEQKKKIEKTGITVVSSVEELIEIVEKIIFSIRIE